MQAIPQKVQSIRFDWMFSPWRDLLYFFLPVPLAFLMFAGAQAFETTNALLFALIAQEVIGLGAFHQGATWYHFLDKRNRDHYFVGMKGLVNFVLAPLALFLGTVAGEALLPAFTFFIYVCWSLNHAVQQNIGILLLYQNSKGNEARASRDIQVASQRWLALCFTLMYFRRLLLVDTPLSEPVWVPIAICGIAGVGYCIAFFASIGKQLAEGKYLNLPAFVFWLLCVTYLIPFAFLGKNYNDALMIPLVVHWCQYIGINYVVAQRKYQETGELENLPFKKPVLLYAVSGFTVVAVLLLLNYFQTAEGDESMPGRLLKGVILGLGMVHYYLDGFIWRFREKFPREAMLPYLVRR